MLHRRDAMIRLGQLGFGGLALPSLLRARASSPSRRGSTYTFDATRKGRDVTVFVNAKNGSISRR